MLAIQYLPYHRIKSMRREDRIEMILSFLRTDRMIIIDGRLDSRDEATLIHKTMSEINEDFHGIELVVLHDTGHSNTLARTKHSVANALTGRNPGLTVIGPASIISEMRQYPENIIMKFSEQYLKKAGKDCAKNTKNTKNI